MNKKGLSDVVVALIGILLALVLIGIVFFVVQNLFSDTTGQIDYSQKCLGANIQVNKFSCDEVTCTVSVERLPGSTEAVDGVQLQFDDTDSSVLNQEGNLLNSKVYSIDLLTNPVNTATKVSAVAYFVDAEDQSIKPCTPSTKDKQ